VVSVVVFDDLRDVILVGTTLDPTMQLIGEAANQARR
jgi:hypothetical protein